MDTYSCRNPLVLVSLMISCLLLAGIPAATAADGTNATSPAGGTIIVRSFPAGAAVYLNDEYLGTAPLKLDNITPGNYLVNVSLAGYLDDVAPIELFDGSTRDIGFNLEPASSATPAPAGTGTIAVDSTPGGAVVMLDGRNVGTTRLDGFAFKVENVPAGSHTITVELAGYPLFTSTVTVLKNQVVKVTADLATTVPTFSGTPVATTESTKPVPLSALPAIAAAGLVGLAAAFRRS